MAARRQSVTKSFTKVQKSSTKMQSMQKNIAGLSITKTGTFSENAKSLHENLVYSYLQKSKLEQALLVGLRSSISGDVIPKNPWCDVSRTLGTTNLRLDIINNFEVLAKKFRKNPVVQGQEYSISEIAYTYKEKKYEEVFTRTFAVSGLTEMLEYIFMPKLKDFYQSIKILLPEFNKQAQGATIQVANSIGGGYALKSELITYPQAHPSDLEIYCEVFIKIDQLTGSYDIFADVVLADAIAVCNKKDLHLIKYIYVETMNEKEQKIEKQKFEIREIQNAAYRKKLKDLIVKAVQANEKIYWKGYCKVEQFENQDRGESLNDLFGLQQYRQTEEELKKNKELNTVYSYIQTVKIFNLHVESVSGKKSFANVPLGSLFKGIFFDYNIAQKYASFFYPHSPVNSWKTAPSFQQFLTSHLTNIQEAYKDQDISFVSWQLFYLALIVDSNELRRNLIDSIVQVISSDFSSIMAISKQIKIQIAIVQKYKEDNFKILLAVINTNYKILKENIYIIFGKASAGDIFRYRDYVFRLLKELEDQKGNFVVDIKGDVILRTLQKVMKFLGDGLLQLVGTISKSISQFLGDTLVKNKLLKENNLYISLEQFLQMKVPNKLLHVSAEKETWETNDRRFTDQDIEDQIVLKYLNDYDLFDNLYIILRDIFFGKQIPNALPQAQFIVEVMALKYQLLEINKTDIRAQMCNPLDPNDNKQRIDVKDPALDFYVYFSEQMSEYKMLPIFGLKESLFYASTFEISGFKLYLDNFPWTKSLKKPIPSSFQVSPIYSISSTNLFSDAGILKRPYIEWNINFDWVIKGPDYQQAQQIFADILMKYVTWMELATNNVILGFFTIDNPTQEQITIDEIIDSVDINVQRLKFLALFTKGYKVYFKMFFKIEQRFKHVNFFVNLHFIDQNTQNMQNLLINPDADYYIRVFFDKSDFMLWNKLYPFYKVQTQRSLTQEIKNSIQQGQLNKAMKYELIKIYLSDGEDLFLTASRFLFSQSEQLVNFAKEADALFFLFKYLYNHDQKLTKVKQKIDAESVQVFFDTFTEFLQREVLQYDNIYLEIIGASIYNQLVSIDEIMNDPVKKQYSQAVKNMKKLNQMCTAVSDSVVLTFRRMMEVNLNIKVLFL